MENFEEPGNRRWGLRRALPRFGQERASSPGGRGELSTCCEPRRLERSGNVRASDFRSGEIAAIERSVDTRGHPLVRSR